MKAINVYTVSLHFFYRQGKLKNNIIAKNSSGTKSASIVAFPTIKTEISLHEVSKQQ